MDFAMRYGLDILLIAVLAFDVIWHVKKGFVRTLLTLLAAIAAFCLAMKAAEPVATWCYDAFLDPMICEKVDEHISDFDDAHSAKEVVNEVARVIPEQLSTILKRINADPNDAVDQIGSVKDGGALTPQQISQKIVKPVAMVVLKIIATLLCYGVLMALFHVLIHLLCSVTKLPVLHSADKLLGGALGFLKGLVLVYLITLLCSLIAQVTTKPEMKQFMEQSSIIPVFQQIDFNGSHAEADQ